MFFQLTADEELQKYVHLYEYFYKALQTWLYLEDTVLYAMLSFGCSRTKSDAVTKKNRSVSH